MKKMAGIILSTLTGAVLGAVVAGRICSDKTKKFLAMSDKHLALYLMMNQWVQVQQEGKRLADYFLSNGYRKIAVYGMSYAGKTLVNDLKDTGITVAYGIDQRAGSLYTDIDIVTMDDKLVEVDAIVVTAISFFDEIEEQLLEKIDCPILSLEDILFEL